MPAATDERRLEVRAALLDAAERRITEHGLSGLQARSLARDVSCAVGAIYTVFPDLDAIVLEVNLRTLGIFERAIGPTPSQTGFATVSVAEDELVRLGRAYLDFAQAHPQRWRTLFQHRLPIGRQTPDWYVSERSRLFRFVEAPLRALRPDLAPTDCMLLARSLFSATHGIVMLGLDEQLMALPTAVIGAQMETLVRAMAVGLQHHRGSRTRS